ncbi:NAD-dependent epimerase/dehydratase family protein [Actinoplanes sp. CA-051413]|uniref:NAD-dependent epimerase/dehydratase family protein n=1 Tax=Actinoplanes sp. CA-051413 TaxID=3239899 RepID=UPI003D9722EB
MRVLVIGGTGFIGGHIATACLERGHEVTVFNRGHHPTPANAATIVGDRRHPSPAARVALATGWDAVIDTCAYSAADMAGAVSARRYVLLSTCGVYQATDLGEIANEDVPVDQCGSAGGKLDCERIAARLSAECLIIRLGVVTGPGDPSGRTAYWFERCLSSRDVLVPVKPEQPVQLADVRDVAAFLADALRSGLAGVVNVAGPVTSFANFIRLVVAATRREPRLHWLPEETVLGAGVQPWRDVPLWLPEGHPFRAHMRTGTDRANRAGLVTRTASTTIEDLAQWHGSTRRWHSDWLPWEREQTILAERG